MNANRLTMPDFRVILRQLVATAEVIFGGTKRGAAKKAWVKAQLKALAAEHDIPGLPDKVENILEGAIIDVAVELAAAYVVNSHQFFGDT